MSYEEAKTRYAALGVDTDAAIARLKTVPVSLQCWQGDDVRGFDTDPNAPLTGGEPAVKIWAALLGISAVGMIADPRAGDVHRVKVHVDKRRAVEDDAVDRLLREKPRSRRELTLHVLARQRTLAAETLNQCGCDVSLKPLTCRSPGDWGLWEATLKCGDVVTRENVMPFASVADEDDLTRFFSIWF